MPEGDTILRAARTMARVLDGETIVAARSTVPALAHARLVGRRIAAVVAHGKYLLIRIDDGRVIATRMRMTGSWHVYRPRERWLVHERFARLVLETERAVAVCFRAPVVELLGPGDGLAHRAISRLGPDVLAPAPDLEESIRRIRSREGLTIAEALLDQSSIAGIGNIYKSEALFASGLDPFRPAHSLADGELLALLRTARRLMASNLGEGPRATRVAWRGERYAVYRRAGLPCPRCGTAVRRLRHGAGMRSTYWCPSCQAARRRSRDDEE